MSYLNRDLQISQKVNHMLLKTYVYNKFYKNQVSMQV